MFQLGAERKETNKTMQSSLIYYTPAMVPSLFSSQSLSPHSVPGPLLCFPSEKGSTPPPPGDQPNKQEKLVNQSRPGLSTGDVYKGRAWQRSALGYSVDGAGEEQ